MEQQRLNLNLKKGSITFLPYSVSWSPVERVVEIWEHSKESLRIVIFMVVPDHIQECKHNVESIKDVEGNQKVVKTYLLLKMSSS